MGSYERYTYRHRPPGVKKVLFSRQPVGYDYLGECLQQTATIYDASTPSILVPIVEISAREKYRCCDVSTRCYESRFAEWYEGLIGRPQMVSTSQDASGAPLPGKPMRLLGKLLAALGLVPISPAESQNRNPPVELQSSHAVTTPVSAPGVSAPPSPPLSQSSSESDPVAAAAPKSSPKPGRLPPGPKPLRPEEVEELRKRWRERPPDMTVETFCHREVISETTFRKYVPDRN